MSDDFPGLDFLAQHAEEQRSPVTPTPEQTALLELFGQWEEAHKVDFEHLLDALRVSFRVQALAEADGNVASCLHAVADHLGEAAMAFYVSLK